MNFRSFLLFTLLNCVNVISFSQHQSDPVKAESTRRKEVQKLKDKHEKQINKVIHTARTYFGTPYHEGGTSKKGIDAVGLVFRSYKSVGITLPLDLEAQSKIGERKYIGEIERGDLLFFSISAGDEKLFSVGIVTGIENGNVYFIQCTSIGAVKEFKLNDPKWKDRYILTRRILE